MSTSTDRPEGRLTHADLGTLASMTADAQAASRALHLLDAAARRPAPSLAYDDYPREVAKTGEVRVDVAAQRIANALELHLD
ncbi:hypothetical protein [Nocardioides bruguierae]|uniref:Uncharacterized protein n=1 Tax=Nocardioides bruguierae TaxID=2945102 RepID=A0A9X2DAL5_9ACTN|nr:hypothetical protein [Nocardioides bruguierae]MCL8027063.1 hypothetical protein [Nocardioides bruguierae]MCM0622201.1 hypothetical protein [Nocardioides bruguierae]